MLKRWPRAKPTRVRPASSAMATASDVGAARDITRPMPMRRIWSPLQRKSGR